jgi:antitoxin MazE
MAFELGLENEGLVELVVRDGNIVIQPVRRVYLLEDLVKEITPENRHSETDWGAAEGAEFS